jgi:uncharacterized membrane-anchored protein YhcB (DUF1043 family)
MEEKKVQADSRLIIWLASMLVLGVGILLGFIIARRTRKKETHIRELEEQLSQSREELAEYRIQVDDYLTQTSELVDQLTASYQAVYMHLAEGARTLSGRDYEAAPLKLAVGDFFDALPADSELEAEISPTSAEEDVIGETADEKVEAEASEEVTAEEEEEKADQVEESVSVEFPEAQERDEQKEAEGEEQDANDVEGRDEK